MIHVLVCNGQWMSMFLYIFEIMIVERWGSGKSFSQAGSVKYRLLRT